MDVAADAGPLSDGELPEEELVEEEVLETPTEVRLKGWHLIRADPGRRHSRPRTAILEELPVVENHLKWPSHDSTW